MGSDAEKPGEPEGGGEGAAPQPSTTSLSPSAHAGASLEARVEGAAEPSSGSEPILSGPATTMSASAATVSASEPRASSEPAPWRFWPSSRRAQAVLIATAIGVAAYVTACLCIRYAEMIDPWAIDGDQPQAVWHYWRYHVAGAFPPGDFHTDYAFVMHAPPVWWALMASLSEIFVPITAAKILNIVACIAAVLLIFVAATRRSNAFIGLAAVLLLVRDEHFTWLVAGGYARSFGPALTFAFLAVFIARKHYWCLGILVLQAAFYPSTVMPCGIAYGIYTVVAGPMRDRLRRMAGMFVAGLLIIAFGRFQDIAAPKWWGPVVTLAEAEQMPSWRAGGRVSEVPLKSIMSDVWVNAEQIFSSAGHVALRNVHFLHDPRMALWITAGLVVVALVVGLFRRNDPFPWEIPLTFAAAFVAYLIARHEAFKLYLPYRPLQHVWPYAMDLAIPLALFALIKALLPRRQMLATTLAFSIATVPMFAFFGDGTDHGSRTYTPQDARAPLYVYLRTLPIDAVLAGELAFVDRAPLLSFHRSYVMRNLAHPFRKGYYAEAERRIIAMYTALYASNLDDVLAFANQEHVDYFVYRPTALGAFDTQVFNGPRAAVEKVYRANKAKGFALQYPPESAIVFKTKDTIVVDVKKLAAAVAAGDRGSPPPPPPLPVFGPELEPPPKVGAPAFIGPLPQK